MIIRHAEKPAAGEGSDDLTPQGFKRAEALHELFEKSDDRPRPFPTPDFIFAATKSKHSNRSVETVAPLAKKLGLEVDSSYAEEDFAKLAEEVLHNSKYAGKTILIAWHHGGIPNLTHALKATDAPDTFNGNLFNRVWRIRYDADGNATFSDRPQRLMPGDVREKVGSR